MKQTSTKRFVLEPEDEYPHEPEAASNYNESMYLNTFDLAQRYGAWFRIGNRINEGYAEVSVCIYLPDGRVGFMFGRPEITTNMAMDAGGLSIDVVEPFQRLHLSYDGQVCLLEDPSQMANPREAFKTNPFVPAQVTLDIRGVSPMWGGRTVNEDGSDLDTDPDASFARAHYEQHIATEGSITVEGLTLAMNGVGLRDKSWGPRHWQAIEWYRWLPMSFGEDFAMMLTTQGRGGNVGTTGMVLENGEYHIVRDVTIDSQWDDRFYQTSLHCVARTDEREYVVDGEVLSLIPLRHRRTDPEGNQLHTRITEAMTRFTCDGRVGLGMSEYLDQIVDGRPVGPDVP